MHPRLWPRLVLAALLLWQLGMAVAFETPAGTPMAQAAAAPGAHCAGHGAGPPAGHPHSTPAGCCQHGTHPCQCVQATLLAVAPAGIQHALCAAPPRIAVLAPAADDRIADFFRPPI
jgi:hypothetical protein